MWRRGPRAGNGSGSRQNVRRPPQLSWREVLVAWTLGRGWGVVLEAERSSCLIPWQSEGRGRRGQRREAFGQLAHWHVCPRRLHAQGCSVWPYRSMPSTGEGVNKIAAFIHVVLVRKTVLHLPTAIELDLKKTLLNTKSCKKSVQMIPFI